MNAKLLNSSLLHGVEQEKSVFDKVSGNPIFHLAFRVTSESLRSQITKALKSSKVLTLRYDNGYAHIGEYFERIYQTKVGESVEMDPYFALNMWLQDASRAVEQLQEKEEDEFEKKFYSKYAALAQQGLQKQLESLDPEAHRNMYEFKSDVTKDPVQGMEQVALSDVVVNTLLTRENVLNSTSYGIYHAAKSNVPLGMEKDEYKKTTGTVFKSIPYSKYIHDRVTGINHKGTASQALQLNTSLTSLPNGDMTAEAFNEKYKYLDGVVQVLNSYAAAVIDLTGSSKESAAFPFELVSRKFTYERQSSVERYYGTSSRTADFLLSSDPRSQNGSAVEREKFFAELIEKKFLIDNVPEVFRKWYHFALAKPAINAVEGRAMDVSPSLDYAKKALLVHAGLTKHAYKYGYEFAERFTDPYGVQVEKRLMDINSAMNGAMSGAAGVLEQSLPKSYLHSELLKDFLTQSGLEVDLQKNLVRGKVRGLTNLLLALIDDGEDMRLRDAVEEMRALGTASERQSSEMKEVGLNEFANDDFAQYLRQIQCPRWDKEEYTLAVETLKMLPDDVWSQVAYKYFPERYEDYVQLQDTEAKEVSDKRLFLLGVATMYQKDAGKDLDRCEPNITQRYYDLYQVYFPKVEVRR